MQKLHLFQLYLRDDMKTFFFLLFFPFARASWKANVNENNETGEFLEQSRKTFSEEFLMLIIHRGYVWERTNGSEGHKTEVTVGLKCLIVGLLNYCYISWESWGITLNQPRFSTSPNERGSNSKYLKLVHQFAYRRSNGSFRFSSPKDYVVMINSDAFLILWIETEECFLRGERCSKINDCVHRRWKIFGKFRLFHFFELRDVLCSSDQ